MIKIEKNENDFGTQIRLIFENNDIININFCSDFNLYFTPESKEYKNNYMFQISEEDLELFNIFNDLFLKLIHYKYMSDKTDINFKKKDKKDSKHPFVKNNIITWISDFEKEEVASCLYIYKSDNKICLFFKEGLNVDNAPCKSVRISTNNSRYDNFFIPFIELYGKITKTNFDCYLKFEKKSFLSLIRKKRINN